METRRQPLAGVGKGAEPPYSDIIAHIGSFIDNPKARARCYSAGKMFSSIHHSQDNHMLRMTDTSCEEKLRNIDKIVKFVRSVYSKLKCIELRFSRCSRFEPFDFEPLRSVEKIEVSIFECPCYASILRFFRDKTIDDLFVSLTRNTLIEDPTLFDTNSKAMSLYLYHEHLDLLQRRECMKNIKFLTIDVSAAYGEFSVCLDNLSNALNVRLIASNLTFRVSNSQHLTELVIKLAISNNRALQWISEATRLKKIVLLNYIWESSHYENLSFYEIMKALPKNKDLRFDIYADQSPTIVPFVKRLMNKCGFSATNIKLVYWDDASYITCKLVKKHLPGVEFSKFDHVYFPDISEYRPPHSLESCSTTRELYDQMSERQKYLWWHVDAAES